MFNWEFSLSKKYISTFNVDRNTIFSHYQFAFFALQKVSKVYLTSSSSCSLFPNKLFFSPRKKIPIPWLFSSTRTFVSGFNITFVISSNLSRNIVLSIWTIFFSFSFNIYSALGKVFAMLWSLTFFPKTSSYSPTTWLANCFISLEESTVGCCGCWKGRNGVGGGGGGGAGQTRGTGLSSLSPPPIGEGKLKLLLSGGGSGVLLLNLPRFLWLSASLILELRFGATVKISCTVLLPNCCRKTLKLVIYLTNLDLSIKNISRRFWFFNNFFIKWIEEISNASFV